IKQSFERNQVQLAVRGNQQVCDTPQEGANRLYDFVGESTSGLLNVFPLRIVEGLPEGSDEAIDLFDRAQVFPSHLALVAHYVSNVAGFAIGVVFFGLRIKWTVDRQLDQGSVTGNC